MLKHLMLPVALGAAALVGTTPLKAEYPEQPIQMIVAFAPGGGTDTAARSIARFMEKHLGGARIAVINRPGAGGEIGWTAVATAKPDGYTIGFINAPAINAMAVEGNAKFTMDDFQPIANIVYDPGVLVVPKDSPYKTLEDFVEAAKADPGSMVIGTSGASGSSEHIALLNFQRLADVKVTPAFFGGTAPARQAVLGGHVPAATMNLSESLEIARGGSVRVLGVMSEERSPELPEVPTFRESGFDMIVGASRGIAAPKGVPPEIIAKLEDAVAKAIEDPEYRKVAEQAEIPLEYMAAERFQAFLDKATADLEETWKVTPWN